jgi:lipopolysaccharide heptosyltransferase II
VSRPPRDGRATAGRWRALARGVGRAWRRLVPADGGDDAPPIALPPTAAILVLQLQQVGDSLMMSPVLRALRCRYPEATIDLLATPVSSAVHRRSPYVRRHHVVSSPAAGPWRTVRTAGAWWRALRAVRRERYDAALSCVNQVSLPYVLASLGSGARHRIGFDAGAAGFLFTRRLAVPAGISVGQANLGLAAAVGGDLADGTEEFWFDRSDEAWVAQALARHHVAADARLAVLHPASNWQSKTWFPDRWAAVADRLAAEVGLHPVFVGTARDAAEVNAVQGLMRTPSTSLAGETELTQLGALLSRAALFVGSDSGPRHIAGALGRPQVTVMSSLDEPWRWDLARPAEAVLRTDPACHGCLLRACVHRLCLDLISVDHVVAACRDVLRRSRLPAAGLALSFT